MNYKSQILAKIASNTETVGIIGLGYVGLSLAVNFAESGVNVIGFDKSEAKVNKINSGENYIKDIRDAVLREVVDKGTLVATTDFTKMKECDALIICVPTPLDKFRKPDTSYIEASCNAIGKNMKPGTFISLESSTYPTTTEDLILPLIEEASKHNPYNKKKARSYESEVMSNTQLKAQSTKRISYKHDKDFWLAYSPERVDPGNKTFHTKNTPKILGAISRDGLEIGQVLYKKAIDTIHSVSSPRVAEMVKILENTYRLVNISLINELALLSGKMDINIWEVIDAAKTKPFGFQAFYPGPGIGGHCIPLDPFYLEHIAKRFDFDLSMIHTAGHIDMLMPHRMTLKITSALNQHKKSINRSKILFMGVAYKANIDDDRESPALKIIEEVVKKGGEVTYHDPYIPEVKTTSGDTFFSIKLNDKILQDADCVVISTNHEAFDPEIIEKEAKLIVDLRNMIPSPSDKVYKL